MRRTSLLMIEEMQVEKQVPVWGFRRFQRDFNAISGV